MGHSEMWGVSGGWARHPQERFWDTCVQAVGRPRGQRVTHLCPSSPRQPWPRCRSPRYRWEAKAWPSASHCLDSNSGPELLLLSPEGDLKGPEAPAHTYSPVLPRPMPDATRPSSRSSEEHRPPPDS